MTNGRDRLRGTTLPVLFLCLVCISFSCIVPFEAETDERVHMLSIEGSLIKGLDTQTVFISRTTALLDLRLDPVTECIVSVVDNLGNEFYYAEAEDGKYEVSIPDEQLVVDRQYKLQVVTPGGDFYESAFETLNRAADVDTVYYEVTDVIDKVSGDDLQGLQFYIDLRASDSTSRYFRWKLNETFEYTSIEPVTYIIMPDTVIFLDNIFEFYRCWKTQKITRLFLSTTENLVLNEKKKIPLNFVSTQSDRLKYKYSLQVEQYTLSKGAYQYWQKKKIETQESGGLYTQQPGKPVSNIQRVGDASETVLGYFWASHKTEQRIFVPRIPSLPVPGDNCEAVDFDPKVHKTVPRYIYVDEFRNRVLTGVSFCFDCTLKHGSTTPPDFWE